MRNPRLLSLTILCTAVLGGCGGGSDPIAAQSGADTLASVTAKSREGRYSQTPGTGSGGSVGTASPTGSPVGRLLASNCFNCHGTDGRPNGGFDQLAGKSASDIANDLREMAAKTDEGGIMRIHAMGYTDEQLWQLGSYFASQR